MKSNRVMQTALPKKKCGACRAVSRFRDPSPYFSNKYNLLTGFCVVFRKHKGYYKCFNPGVFNLAHVYKIDSNCKTENYRPKRIWATFQCDNYFFVVFFLWQMRRVFEIVGLFKVGHVLTYFIVWSVSLWKCNKENLVWGLRYTKSTL